MTMQQQKQMAYDMTMEYFRQNNLFAKTKGYEDDIVKEFAETENAFYDSLTINSHLFNKCL